MHCDLVGKGRVAVSLDARPGDAPAGSAVIEAQIGGGGTGKPVRAAARDLTGAIGPLGARP
jgi:hypothetical protein